MSSTMQLQYAIYSVVIYMQLCLTGYNNIKLYYSAVYCMDLHTILHKVINIMQDSSNDFSTTNDFMANS